MYSRIESTLRIVRNECRGVYQQPTGSAISSFFSEIISQGSCAFEVRFTSFLNLISCYDFFKKVNQFMIIIIMIIHVYICFSLSNVRDEM